jgi:hypothetical protein
VAEYSMPQFVQTGLAPLWLRVLSHRYPRVTEIHGCTRGFVPPITYSTLKSCKAITMRLCFSYVDEKLIQIGEYLVEFDLRRRLFVF